MSSIFFEKDLEAMDKSALDDEAPQRKEPAIPLKSLIGMEKREAEETIAKFDPPTNPFTGEPIGAWRVRVRSKIVNGKETHKVMFTMDFRADRINLWFVDGKVVKTAIG